MSFHPRKQSIRGDLALADFGPDDNLNENLDIQWINKPVVRYSRCQFTSVMISECHLCVLFFRQDVCLEHVLYSVLPLCA